MAKISYVETKPNIMEQLITWEGMSKEEEEMANKALDAMWRKEAVSFQNKDGETNMIVRMTGDFWLNNQKDPLEEKDVIDWIENQIKNTRLIESFDRYTEKQILQLKRIE